MQLFLDANVLFSAAHHAGGNARAIFQLASAGYCDLVTSRFAWEEARRNLVVKYPAALRELDALLQQLAVMREPTAGALAEASRRGLPVQDVPILAAAIAAQADVLVTGDRRDFGSLFGQRIEGVLVVPPVRAVDLVLE